VLAAKWAVRSSAHANGASTARAKAARPAAGRQRRVRMTCAKAMMVILALPRPSLPAWLAFGVEKRELAYC
jgi:hypothetical protein